MAFKDEIMSMDTTMTALQENIDKLAILSQKACLIGTVSPSPLSHENVPPF